MALNAFLHLHGEVQGKIKGSVIQKGREGKIMVVASQHAVESPRDPSSGQATGRRQHKVFTITKEIDSASPLLYKALSINETFKEWELQFWAPQLKSTTGTGAEMQHYTVRLSGAAVTQIRFVQPDTRGPETARIAETEEVSFAYSRIEWLWVKGAISSSDDWNNAPQATAKPAKSAKASKVAKADAKVAKAVAAAQANG